MGKNPRMFQDDAKNFAVIENTVLLALEWIGEHDQTHTPEHCEAVKKALEDLRENLQDYCQWGGW